MDFTCLNGIIDAIEGEIKNPHPHHLNLARLTIAALREVKVLVEASKVPQLIPVTISSGNDAVKVEITEPKPKKRKAKNA